MKKDVVIIFGGPGKEHSISIKSAKSVISVIERKKFNVNEVFINKKMDWFLNGKKYKVSEILKSIKQMICLPLIHGEFGEDGKLQKILENNKIHYIGTDSMHSKITIDKFKTQKKLEGNNILLPKSFILNKATQSINLEFPIIIKPISEGSSVGLVKINNLKNIKLKLEKIFKKYSKSLAQEFIGGREFACSVVEFKGKNIALPVTEIVLTKSKLFDYKSKYTKGACEEITPAIIENKLANQIKKLALNIHSVMGCKDFSRSDFILSGDKLYVLEVNTVPGMTQTSFMPAQLDSSGIGFKPYINYILGNSFKD